MNKILVFIILFFPVTLIQAEKVATLDKLLRPDMITIGNNRICITEGASVLVYSLEDYRLVKKFGKKGEGPREFKIVPFGPPMVAIPYNDKIFVSSNSKLSVFTLDGVFIKESKVKPFTVFLPFRNNFLATAMVSDDKKQTVLGINLYNERFEKLKTLYTSDMQVGPSANMNFPFNSFAFLPYKDRAYVVAGKEGFVIDVFDQRGTKLYRIKKEFKPLKIPAEFKKKTEEWFKTNSFYKQFWEYMKTRLSYKNQYPAIRGMDVQDDRIYVLTYKMKAEKSEFIIMDLKGNEQKRVYLPCPENIGMDYYPKYAIHNGNFYTLIENEDDEVWELHKNKLIK